MDACEAVEGDLFVTFDSNLLLFRDWLQDRMDVFVLNPFEALDYIDVYLKRHGKYLYRPHHYIEGVQGYYFNRICEIVPSFGPSWASSLFGDQELPNGGEVQHYLQSFYLRLETMFEAKDRIADQYYLECNNDSLYLMLRELNLIMILATATFDSLAWLCRYLYGFRAQESEDEDSLRHRVTFKLRPKQVDSNSANGLVHHIRHYNQMLAQLVSTKRNQDLMGIFYPARDSIQHRHPMKGLTYVGSGNNTRPTSPQDRNKAFSLAILDEDTELALRTMDQDEISDYFSKWGIRYSGARALLEPYKFARRALLALTEFYEEFFRALGLPAHDALSEWTKKSVRSTEDERRNRTSFAVPFLLREDNPPIPELLEDTPHSLKRDAGSRSTVVFDKRSMALSGWHQLFVDLC